MSTLTKEYWLAVQEIHPRFKWWIETTKTDTPSGIMEGIEGKLEIYDLPIPHNKVISPMSKIFSSVRRRFLEETKVSVTGLFIKRADIICGNFLPNYATCDDDNAAIKKVNADFTQLFNRLQALFEEAIDAWLLDSDNGYAASCHYTESRTDDEIQYDECNEMFNRYLIAARIKTVYDEKEKLRRKKAAKKLA